MRNKSETVGPLVLALRHALDISQDTFADRCGLAREHVSNVERGVNKASSALIREALAKGAGVPFEQMHAYLEKRISLAELLKKQTKAPNAAA